MRLGFRHSLRFRMILLLILGLLLSHSIGYLLYSRDRRDVVSTTEAFDVAERASGVVVLLRNLPTDWREAVLNAADSRAFRVWTSGEPILPRIEASNEEEEALAYLRALLPRLAARDMRVAISATLPPTAAPPHRAELPGAPAGGSIETANKVVTISIHHPDGFWLNFVGVIPESIAIWPGLLAGYLISAVVGVAIVSFMLVHRVTQPLEDFARAAERLGKDIQTAPLDESAPTEVAQAAQAFNRMQERLARLVRNRTELLAGVSHDLRTPITQLKLRSELIENSEERDKFVGALEEMEEIIATFLEYARSTSSAEERSKIELGSLVESICTDMADAGADVEFSARDPIHLECKRLALKRCVGNVIENAVKYAGGARVSLRKAHGEVVIQCDDDGPGIAPGEIEDVLMPFRRGDRSRNRATGGVGLGLSIAQAVALDHGGRIILANRREGGLAVQIIVPA